ncbi:exosome complex component RRP42-like [Acanthaster planci]|uniref:Ribosomal RNA-processing protein 42 n=1 Tax=Acanthaster planci TaxID=133434 RepID=A0A8B7YQ17_ACAPL|nr:exosome complex component RRP42-like [Acanthaster planci]
MHVLSCELLADGRMAKVRLSAGEKTFIIHGVQDGLRTDGRSCDAFRPMELECGVVSNTSGSARLRLSNTDILVGVKAEMGKPRPTRPGEGYVEFFIDLSANASPEFEGRGGEELATEIANTLSSTYDLTSVLDYTSLCVLPEQCCWVLYVDVVVLECGGNLFDAIGIAVKAALYNTRIPKVKVQDGEGQEEIEVSDDPHDVVLLDTSNMPVLVTVSKVGQQHVVDATLEEEACCLACIVMAVNPKGALVGMEKKGASSLTLNSIQDMITTGKKVGMNLNSNLSSVLQEIGQNTSSTGLLS